MLSFFGRSAFIKQCMGGLIRPSVVGLIVGGNWIFFLLLLRETIGAYVNREDGVCSAVGLLMTLGFLSRIAVVFPFQLVKFSDV